MLINLGHGSEDTISIFSLLKKKERNLDLTEETKYACYRAYSNK
jgi:hypothetical protein